MLRFTLEKEQAKKLGKRISERRMRFQLSLEDLEERTGLEKYFIDQLEQGRAAIVDPKALILLGKSLRINYIELYTIVGFIDNHSMIRYMIGDNDFYEEMCEELKSENYVSSMNLED